MATTCPECGADVAAADRFCAQCGAATPAVADDAQPRNLARIAQVVALVGFVLPWITVSCQGRVIAEVSGLDMALGRATIHNPFTDVSHVHNGSPDGVIAVALALVVGGLALSFNLRAARAAPANVVACAAALLLIGYEVLVSAGGTIRSHVAPASSGEGFERSLSESIRVGTGLGFWLTGLALAGAIFFYWKARRRGGAPAPTKTRPPPPPQRRTNRAADGAAPT